MISKTFRILFSLILFGISTNIFAYSITFYPSPKISIDQPPVKLTFNEYGIYKILVKITCQKERKGSIGYYKKRKYTSPIFSKQKITIEFGSKCPSSDWKPLKTEIKFEDKNGKIVSCTSHLSRENDDIYKKHDVYLVSTSQGKDKRSFSECYYD